MAKFSEICNTSTLQKLRDKIHREEMEIVEMRFEEEKRKWAATHIFDNYEQALDWCAENPEREIDWHCKTIHWDPEKNVYVSYEQEHYFDDCVIEDVVRVYTREQLLHGINHFIFNNGYTLDDLKENDKLEYVSIH